MRKFGQRRRAWRHLHRPLGVARRGREDAWKSSTETDALERVADYGTRAAQRHATLCLQARGIRAQLRRPSAR